MVSVSQLKDLEFYKNLGTLFYAIAAVDNRVRDEEIVKLQDIVKSGFLTQGLQKHKNRVEAETIIISTFNWLRNDAEYDAETCFTNFMLYKKTHEHVFNKHNNSLILATAAKIAASFSGTNKSELIMLARLDIEFKKNTHETEL